MARIKLPPKIQNSRPMDYRFVDYVYCQYKVQELGLSSARAYIKWQMDYKPAGFPRRPDRVYFDYWISWNEFFAGNNTFLADAPHAVRKEDIMPYWEAVNIVQEFQFTSRNEYEEAHDAGLIPKGIPKYPYCRYKVFYIYGGYPNWVGKNVKHKIASAKNIQPYLILHRMKNRADNILSIIIYKKGKAAMANLIRDNDIQVVKIFLWYPDFSEHVFNLMNAYGTQQDDASWMFANVNDILFELGTVLEPFKP